MSPVRQRRIRRLQYSHVPRRLDSVVAARAPLGELLDLLDDVLVHPVNNVRRSQALRELETRRNDVDDDDVGDFEVGSSEESADADGSDAEDGDG